MPYKKLRYENKKNFINHINDDGGRDESWESANYNC